MDISEEIFDFEESNSVASGEEEYVADEVALNESFQQESAGSEEEQEEDDDDNVADENIVVIHATVLDFIKVIIEKGDAKAAFSSSNSTENEWKFAATLIWNSITTNPELKDSKEETLQVAATEELLKVMKNLPSVEYFREKFFQHMPNRTWSPAFVAFVESIKVQVPSEQFYTPFVKLKKRARKKRRQSSEEVNV